MATNRKFEHRLVPAAVPRVRTFGLAVIAAAALLAGVGVMPASALPPTITTFSPTGQNPAAIAIDWDGNIFTANYGSNDVSKFTPLGTPTQSFASTGAGSTPYAILIDPSGAIITANYTSSTLTLILPNGAVLGTVILPVGSGPQGMTFDSAGNIYTANFGSNNVSKITRSEGVVSTLGSTDNRPNGITIDSAGNIYTSNFTANTVTKITPGGIPTTLASTIPSGGTGNGPSGITIDSTGNIYTSNRASNNVTKITPGGTASTLGVTGNSPIGITIDSAGNIYTANNGSDNVTRITPGGTASPLASTGVEPYAITIDANGNIYTSNQELGNVTATVTKIGVSGGTDQIFASPPHKPAAPSAVAGAELATVTAAPNEASAVYGTPSSYTVTAVQDASKSCTVTVPATSCQVSGLSSGTSYSFTARANLNTWRTAASDPSSSVTPTLAPPSAPPAPTAVAGDGTARVTVAAGPGNTPASYRVTASPGGRTCTVTGAAGSCLISGLTNGTGYRFTATATNAGGTSSSSAASSAVTPRPPLTVQRLKAKVGRASAYLSSRATVSTAGKITQAATTGSGRKKKTWCKTTKTSTAASSHTLKCNLGAKGRKHLRRQALKLTVTTVFRRSTGSAVTKSSRLTIRRSR